MIAKQGIQVANSYGPYNKVGPNKRGEMEHWIRLTEGCPNQCPFCYEPKETKLLELYPKILCRKCKIMDMNLLCKVGALGIIRHLGNQRVDGKVIYYELICGVDHRFLTLELAIALKMARFKNIRIAWDFGFDHKYKIKATIETLLRARYNRKEITVFMICNWETTYEETLKKFYQCGVWGLKVADCWFDGQTSPNIKPLGWNEKQIKTFRKLVRKHNQIMNFGIDPELKD